jgi:hypothetical protein
MLHKHTGDTKARACFRNFDGRNPGDGVGRYDRRGLDDQRVGRSGSDFSQLPLAFFDLKLGTLLSVSESVSGSLTWDFGADTGDTLLLALGKAGASQFF